MPTARPANPLCGIKLRSIPELVRRRAEAQQARRRCATERAARDALAAATVALAPAADKARRRADRLEMS